MANYPKYDLTGKTPAATYTELILYNVESASLVNGAGNDLPQLNITASQAASASWAPIQGSTAFSISSSFASSSINAITSSIANNVQSPTQVVIRSSDSIFSTCPNGMTLIPTGALLLASNTGNVTLSPAANVEVQGNLIVDASITASAISLSNGLTATKSFVDGNNLSHSVFISSGIITAWTIV